MTITSGILLYVVFILFCAAVTLLATKIDQGFVALQDLVWTAVFSILPIINVVLLVFMVGIIIYNVCHDIYGIYDDNRYKRMF